MIRRVAVFGENRIKPLEVYFECSITEFEKQVTDLILKAKEKKSSTVEINDVAFWLEDFYVGQELDLYKKMTVRPLETHLMHMKHRSFIHRKKR